MTIVEWRMVDVASLGLFKIDRSTQKLTTGRIHYSMFDVERSVFEVHQFLVQFDWKFAANGDACIIQVFDEIGHLQVVSSLSLKEKENWLLLFPAIP